MFGASPLPRGPFLPEGGAPFTRPRPPSRLKDTVVVGQSTSFVVALEEAALAPWRRQRLAPKTRRRRSAAEAEAWQD